MYRRFEVIKKDITRSKLTVAPDRITLKISEEDRDKEEYLIQAAEEIADQIIADVTARGRFDLPYKTIYMQYGKTGQRFSLD